ncbi:MAG TPA: hypothetical protein VJV23_04415 [Candidatus Polarisedimenticolia bacterium]|nr:hypothetical protein [Candidatus Polarisedimenticolia bacterium]
MKLGVIAASAAAAAVLTAAPAVALDRVENGVYRLDPERMDELLELEKHQDLRVLLIDDTSPKATSEVHSRMLRNFIQNGGVVWVEGEAAESRLVEMLATGVNVEDFDFKKATTGKKGGELVVRGASPRLRVHSHPLTEGVQQLYIHPARKFDGTRNAQPLVEMTDTEGNHGIVVAAVPVGQGYLVLDGTRREGAGFWRLGRGGKFDKDHPNAVRQANGEWNNYDWDRLLENARSAAEQRMSPPAPGSTSGT